MISSRIRQEDRKAIRDFTLFDDTFMSIVFDENLECVEFVLHVILGKKLNVIESSTQHQVKNLKGNSRRLDVRATDDRGKV